MKDLKELQTDVDGFRSPLCSVVYCRRGFLSAVLLLPLVKTSFGRKRQSFEAGTLKPGRQMTHHQQVVWNTIAERNTAALNQLIEMKRRGIRPTVCSVERIPNPFM